MINTALHFLASQLNQYLSRKNSSQEKMVVVSKITENDGRESELTSNKLTLFLVNVEKDNVTRPNSKPDYDGFRNIVHSKPIFLNLHVVLAANFQASHYEESLKYLSKAVAFFQDHNVFDHTSFPDLASGIEKLIIDVENLNLQELSNLWNLIGCKYIPSVMYKVRTVALGSNHSYYRPHIIHVSNNATIGVL